MARWVPSPCGRLSRPRTTTDPPPRPGPSADSGPALRRLGRATGRAIPGWFPRSSCVDRRDGRPALPLQHRHEYATVLPRGLPTECIRSASESPAASWRPACAAPRPTSTRFEPVSALRGFSRWFTLVAPLRLAGRAGPSGGADPSRPCRGCSRPLPRFRDQAAPSFLGPLRQPEGGVLSPPLDHTTPRGAQCCADAHVSPLPGKVRLVGEAPNLSRERHVRVFRCRSLRAGTARTACSPPPRRAHPGVYITHGNPSSPRYPRCHLRNTLTLVPTSSPE
jgi:hypothetical protein